MSYVVLTDTAYITAQFPFNLVAFYCDGIHRISLSSITDI